MQSTKGGTISNFCEFVNKILNYCQYPFLPGALLGILSCREAPQMGNANEIESPFPINQSV